MSPGEHRSIQQIFQVILIIYYGLTHKHPNANSRYTTESLMHLMAFDVDDRMDLVDQPLLMAASETDADRDTDHEGIRFS